MTIHNTVCRVTRAGIAAAEAYSRATRRRRRCEQYDLALGRALELQRPLVIFGDTCSCAKGQALGYRFSVVIPVIGMQPMCEEDAPRDLAEVADDSVVVLADGVLYARDPDTILAELRRIAGVHLFFGAQLQPWTLTATALARRTSASSDLRAVPTIQRVGVARVLAAVVAGALRT